MALGSTGEQSFIFAIPGIMTEQTVDKNDEDELTLGVSPSFRIRVHTCFSTNIYRFMFVWHSF